MTNTLSFTYDGNTSSPDRFTEWFEEERGTGIDYDMEDDVDSTDEDSFNDPESL